jgi:hypothetical protein
MIKGSGSGSIPLTSGAQKHIDPVDPDLDLDLDPDPHHFLKIESLKEVTKQ